MIFINSYKSNYKLQKGATMKKLLSTKLFVLLTVGILGLSGNASADTSKLIGSLVDLLGVTKPQAEGGAGAVFREAKNNMSSSDYSQLLSALPGIDSLIDAAPEAGGLASSASSMLGGSSGSAGQLAALTDSFKKLGLSSDMINKYVDIIMDFAQSEGGQQAMSLLKNALL
jgi:hypothetical protein